MTLWSWSLTVFVFITVDENAWNVRVLLLPAVVGTLGVFVEPPQSVTQQRSLAESQTRLPCRYQVQVGEKVVQVTWFKQLPGGTKDQIITAHFEDGQTGRLQRLLCLCGSVCVFWMYCLDNKCHLTGIAGPQVQQQFSFSFVCQSEMTPVIPSSFCFREIET